MTSSDSIDSVARRSRLSVVGVAKNCGKTTTLNHLLKRRQQLELRPPSLLSVGVDGESEDVLLGTDKPPIVVAEDQWVATAEEAIRQSRARFEYVERLHTDTPLGAVYVCRALSAGAVKLAGLRRLDELEEAVALLEAHGPGPVWLDGAYGRVVGADARLTDAVVVATGGVVGGDCRKVAESTAALLARLQIDRIERERDDAAIRRAVDDGVIVIVDADDGVRSLELTSAVAGLENSDRWHRDTTEAIAIPGLVSNRVVELLLGEEHPKRVLIPDGTAVHADTDLWQKLREQREVRALRGVDVVAISYNPTSPTGEVFPAGEMDAQLREIADTTPVFNPLG